MAQVSLRAETGRALGSRATGRLRKQGLVPGIVYGQGLEPLPVTVDHHDLSVALHTEAGRNVLISLELAGQGPILTLAKTVDRHPYKNQIRHVDFVKVSLTEKVEAIVTVVFEGAAPGLKEGGIIAPGKTQVEVEALPSDIPPRITLDLSELHLGQHLRVSDLPVIPGVVYLDDPDEIVVSMAAPAAVEAPEAAPTEVEAAGEAEEAEPEATE
jgi:large subunit ribosomal protein L25